MFHLNRSKAVVIGVASDRSIAWGNARALQSQSEDVARPFENSRIHRDSQFRCAAINRAPTYCFATIEDVGL